MTEKSKLIRRTARPQAEDPADNTNIQPEAEATNDKEESKLTDLTRLDVIKAIFSGYGESGTDVLKGDTRKIITQYLKQIAVKNAVSKNYNILVLYDNTSLIRGDADNIYNAVTNFNKDKPLLLVLYSSGGSAGSAYLIGKLCREYSNGKFIITVPRHAKSAATLICCAANEIHMGSLSELGPIDPQIDGLPALGLKNSIEHIAELVKANPESTDMFAKYLNSSLTLINLGYYERVAESAMQYAEKLLNTHIDNLPRSSKEIAEELVYRYKDHGFVIDKYEAEQIFGDKIIKTNSLEYELGNDLYRALDNIRTWVGYFKMNFYLIGSLDTEPSIIESR
jgi:hypothetical protein